MFKSQEFLKRNTLERFLSLFIASAIMGIELFGGQDNPKDQGGYAFLIIIFLLSTVVVITLIVSWLRIAKVKKEYVQIQRNNKELEDKQNELLSSMSLNIHKIVKQAIGTSSTSADKKRINEAEQELTDIVQAESQLLDIANDLIEFLHLKAKKVKISNNRYNLDNLLNDITGFISKSFRIKSLNLTYKIDKSIPDELIGDTLKISKVLYNLLDYSIRNGATDLLLHVYKAPGFQSKHELTFLIHTNMKIDVENDPFFFKTQYDEENSKYDSLGLFVAKELATLMKGELITRNDENKEVEFLFSMTFHSPDNLAPRVQDSRLFHKKTLIVESNVRYADAIKEMLEVYEHKVTILAPEIFFQNQQILQEYNLIILDEKLFNASVIKSLEKLDKQKDIKVIALSNFFNPLNAKYYTKIADYKILKPTIRGTLRRLLKIIYLPQEEQEAQKAQELRGTKLKVYTEEFANTPDVSIDTFALFKGYKLLIVEDDVINQRVLQGVLKRSGMVIDIANNGEECLALLKEKKHYDMILMDINMPTMDGYTATREIRHNSEYDSIPIISLTALISPDEINKMFNLGMNAHLAKPFRKEKLFTAFDMFLKSTNEDIMFLKPKEDKLTHYDGLDIKRGIAQANDNEEFYKEILTEFLATYQESAKVFEKLIHDFRYEQVRLYCLDIKGLSDLIGAKELRDLMMDIHHQLIFKKFDMLDNYIQPFHKTIDTVNASIKEYIES